MIIIVHHNNKTVKLLDANMQPLTTIAIEDSISKSMKLVAQVFSDELIIWCHQNLIDHLNVDSFSTVFHHKRILASYNLVEKTYLPKQIGYIERSYFLKMNKSVTYPTWLMNSQVGGVHASVINNLKDSLKVSNSFDYFLNSLAKRAMVEGLFCYSEPKLLKPHSKLKIETSEGSTYTLFKFVKQHYKWVWVFFLSLCYLIYEKKLVVFPLLKSLFYRQLPTNFNLESIKIKSSKKVAISKTIDVVIPTIARKQYLFDVLKDLAKQTHLPNNVIIVEQNPLENSVSELNYLSTNDWPFNIKHTFTHQSGVCNARNVALAQIESEWTFLADDDIRFETDFFENSFKEIDSKAITALNYLCLQPKQHQTYFKLHQTTVFGSGSSMVKSEALKGLKFNMAYEFGFGEDSEFGMQLRSKGTDVVFIPNLKITHLKAPIGGYRTKVKQLWADDVVMPKPSPTIMLLNQTYFTDQQLLGYKLLLGLRSFKHNKIKNPIAYIKQYKKQWERSQFWSAKLRDNTNA
ncbi:glycosyltransferase family 2 protein [Olleya sp. R77988]|uniref:glycosyltransferase family 2 protein n=1 Tax=Olleya sp. R77988 TaxID=3093875 RepID=UPI0037CB7A4D